MRIRLAAVLVAHLLLPALALQAAEKKYAPGVSDTEIKIGQTMPYSGPASAYGTLGKVELAYFRMINEQGGVNGRKITLVSLDDGYAPPKTLEQTRKLVEQEQVAFIFGSLGTPPNTAIHKYLNDHKVPHLFIAAGGSMWNDPKHFPWTMGWQPSLRTEGAFYARYLLTAKPAAKIAVLYQNDDFGKDLLAGVKEGLGDKAATMIVKEASYEVSDATVDSQIATLANSGADMLFNFASPKFTAQAIRKSYDIGWKPLQILHLGSASVSAILTPAGLDKSEGLLTSAFLKDATDPRWQDDAATKEWLAFMQKYYPEGSTADNLNVGGYSFAQTLVHVLMRCGDDLSRENIMKQAASIQGLSIPMLLPGITISTAPDDYRPIRDLKLVRFNGKNWELVE